MNTSLFAEKLLSNCSLVQPPFLGTQFDVGGHDLPKGAIALLNVANGFVTRTRFFRVFGTHPTSEVPSLAQWNNSEWKCEYGHLAKDVIFIGEDIFGDQYGYLFQGERPIFVKFYCEGGSIEPIHDGINHFIQSLIEPKETVLLDWSLLNKASQAGKFPAANQHLAFRVPLIVGGSPTEANLAVESVALHLGTLAQLSVRNQALPDKTPEELSQCDRSIAKGGK